MANKDGHRRFGAIRKLPSGRYQARYLGPDGLVRKAPETFARKGDAERYLTVVEAQLLRSEWTDPVRAEVRLSDYAARWIAQRPGLRPRTVHLYQGLLSKHIAPHLGKVLVGRLSSDMVRGWRAALLDRGVSQSVAAKAYRLLRAVLMTAVKEDEIITKNPCRIPGADQEKPAERPTLTLAQVFALAEAVSERYRCLVLVATFASLRWGEITALQRQDIDAVAGTVTVRQAYVELRGQGLVLGPPKSRAGRRLVTIPAAVRPALRAHLDEFVGPEPDAHVFTGPTGRPIWRGNFNKLTNWLATVAELGVPGFHFHDLRHTGNTLAARTGASLRDLMARMGHDSPDAAMIYQHATRQADQAIADAVSAQVDAHHDKTTSTKTTRTRRPRKSADGDKTGAI